MFGRPLNRLLTGGFVCALSILCIWVIAQTGQGTPTAGNAILVAVAVMSLSILVIVVSAMQAMRGRRDEPKEAKDRQDRKDRDDR